MGCYFSKPISSSPPEIPHPLARPFELKIFKYKELQRATQQFKDPETVLGEGGFGKVYKGWLRDPLANYFPVAVKKLKPDSFQGHNEWLAEISVLGRLCHSNLVRLIGFCADQGEGLLVYEFLAKGSLNYHLFRERNHEDPQPDLLPVLSWDTRLRIALDAAEGLAFLHENNIIHRDFKAPKILLDEDYRAKLSFGLVERAETDMGIMGTLGYIDPNYIKTGQLTKKSDVYAFGILLLELLTGRRAVDLWNMDQQPLAQWTQPYLKQELPEINGFIDPDLKEQVAVREAWRAACKLTILARLCTKEDPNVRPLMSEIVETLRPLVQSIARPFELEVIKYEELERATQQFKDPEMVLGEGWHGKVFKGWLRDPLANEAFLVAVKKFNPDCYQGKNEWLAEMLVLGRLRHSNLVQSIGYCADQGEVLFVYEFLAKGSLDYNLFRKRNPKDPQPDLLPVLSWDTRLRIALDAAEGLAFLHENNVIHHDFKAPKILLDEDYRAKLAFGLAERAESDSQIMGTMGYIDPNYMKTGQLTKKSDVYAFGILLLELLTGRRAWNPDQQPLAQWTQPYLKQELPEINGFIDPDLKEQVAVREAWRAACKLAILSRLYIKEDPNVRPLMSEILETIRPLVQSIGT